MKKKIFAIAVIAICLSILASASMAYYVSEGTAHSVISSSGVDIVVEEWQEQDNAFVPYPEKSIKVMPATEVSKLVILRNLQAESFVRASYQIIMKDASGAELDFDENMVTVTMGSEKWLKKAEDDGFWYYSETLAPDEASEEFIRSVSFDGPTMTNKYQGAEIEVKIIAQAVQAANNADSVMEVHGWPSAGEE